MAAFRAGIARIIIFGQNYSRSSSNPPSFYHHPLQPSQLLCSRGIAYKLFVGGIRHYMRGQLGSSFIVKKKLGLSFYTTEKSLSESFSQFGQVIEAKIVMDRVSDRSKGFGFVTFASEEEAEKAISEMNGKVLNGRTIFVDTAKPTRTNYSDQMPIASGPPKPSDDN